jgi:uncharacterized SAM-binding protein YcdF (DUF218 family)
MSWGLLVLLIAIGGSVAVWLASLLMEQTRRSPSVPKSLAWAPDIAIDYVTVNGQQLRYIRVGRGPYPCSSTYATNAIGSV